MSTPIRGHGRPDHRRIIDVGVVDVEDVHLGSGGPRVSEEDADAPVRRRIACVNYPAG